MIKLQKTGKGNNMEINKTVSLIASLAIASSVFTGCATTTLQTKAKMTRTIILDHSKNEDKTIYLQVTNTSGSGGEDMELYSSLKTKLQQKGYTVLNSSKNAGYGLFVNVLFANNLKEANSIKSGLSLGGAVGSISHVGGTSGRDSLAIGAAAALGGALIGKALEDEVFRAVVDISIREYTNKQINTIRTQSDSGATFHNVARAGELNQFAGKLGDTQGGSDMNSGIDENTTTQTSKNYEEFKTRSFVEATKMNLKLEEALPILEAKITKQIANLF
jgi:outer membrane lipoprotein SlyB